ncbi:hypothetical protein F183_A04930 [Bryobacterales bacterium F-183]|nr:hypothetical protein F183_A04930 [Bryobacterales bacterium F-183]
MLPLPCHRRRIVTLLAACTTAFAGGIKGIAVENLTGFPMARANITLVRLEGSAFRTVTSSRTGSNGQFQFLGLADGYYQVIARRPGFAEARAGQSYRGGAGTPIQVQGDPTAFAELRLRRLGAIFGRTLDENRVGLPRVPVSAYTVTLPRRIVATGISDDLGVYRITGLPAGKYFVRSGTAEVDQNFFVAPTYHPFASMTLRDAIPISVDLDSEVRDIDLAPVPGRTAAIAIRVTGCIGVAEVTLSSDQGRKQMPAPCNLDPIQFTNLTPGEYELLVQGEGDQKQKLAAFKSMQVYTSSHLETLNLRPLPKVTFQTTGTSVTQAGLILRRRDAAGPDTSAQATEVHVNPIQVVPGNWQLTQRPQTGSYLSEVTFHARQKAAAPPDPDWFEFSASDDTSNTIQLTFSTSPAKLTGKVKGSSPIGVPVYLFPTSPQARQRTNGVRTAYIAEDGSYAFVGVAPGPYLVIASLEALELLEDALSGRAQPITLEEGRTATLDLTLQ